MKAKTLMSKVIGPLALVVGFGLCIKGITYASHNDTYDRIREVRRGEIETVKRIDEVYGGIETLQNKENPYTVKQDIEAFKKSLLEEKIKIANSKQYKSKLERIEELNAESKEHSSNFLKLLLYHAIGLPLYIFGGRKIIQT